MEPRPTLRDVAQRAGVSKTTASLAMRDHTKIPLATRNKVKLAAAEIRYRPDPILSHLAAHRWKQGTQAHDPVIAYVSTRHPVSGVEPEPEIRRGAMAYGERLGYRVEHFAMEQYRGAEHLGRVLQYRGVRGVIIGKVFDPAFVRDFPWEHFSATAADVGYVRPPVNTIMPDFLRGVVDTWKRAFDGSYRRIGAAFLKEPAAFDRLDKDSAVLFCQSQFPCSPCPVPLQHFSTTTDRAPFRSWLRRHRPDVVLGFNDTVYWWLREEGCRMPEDLAFVSLITEPSGPGDRVIAGLEADWAAIGRLAVEQVDILLRTNQAGLPERPVVTEVPCIWHDGSTFPAARVSAARRQRPDAALLASA